MSRSSPGHAEGDGDMVGRFVGIAVAAGAAAVIIGAPAPAQAGTGQRVAFVRAGSVYLRAGATEVRLTRDADDTRPRWSPDGTRLAFGHAGRLWVMNADGTGRRAVATGALGGGGGGPPGGGRGPPPPPRPPGGRGRLGRGARRGAPPPPPPPPL